MTICSLIVQAVPERKSAVTAILSGMDGVEIHASDESGKLVVSIDHPDSGYCSQAMTSMTRITGVMSTSLVYEYQENLENLENLENQKNNTSPLEESK